MYGFNILSTARQWVMRARGRRQLWWLLNDQRLLADIGASRSVAEIEAERAFWDGAGR